MEYIEYDTAYPHMRQPARTCTRQAAAAAAGQDTHTHTRTHARTHAMVTDARHTHTPPLSTRLLIQMLMLGVQFCACFLHYCHCCGS